MPEIITMDGKWAYARDPYMEVRILCTDAAGMLPVVSIDADGLLRLHGADGKVANGHKCNLVPLQVRRQPVEAWALVGPNGGTIAFAGSRHVAGSRMYEFPGSRLVRLVEAEDAP